MAGRASLDIVLSDGSRLTNPQPRSESALQIGDRVRKDGAPWRITNLRRTSGGGRVVDLDGHGPLILAARGTVDVYTVTAPPTRQNRLRRPAPGRAFNPSNRKDDR